MCEWGSPLPIPGIPSHPGGKAARPREGAFLRPALAELDGGARSFAGGTRGCCVGERHATAVRPRGGPVALGIASVPRGMIKRR